MLSPYRVLDCTDDRGALAGFMLAQLGADVVLVEPPEGSSVRHRGPYAFDRPGPETSLRHWAYSRGKRSVVLDWTSPRGRERLADLAEAADILLWSGRPDGLPLPYDELAERNPTLVVAALTPFGLTGPKAGWADSDLAICASACHAAITGDTDRPPLRCGIPQSYLHGAGDLAVGALVALTERGRSGRGQLVDVSAQASFLQAGFSYALNEAWQAPPSRALGEGVNVGPFKIRWGYPAADGEVSITLLFGAAFKEFTPNLFRWIWEEGGCDEATRDKPWEDLTVLLLNGTEPLSELDRIADVIADFTGKRSKAELLAEAQRRRVLLAPVAGCGEVVEHDHLAARGYWDDVRHPLAGRAYRHPGRFLVASGAPLRSLPPAPALGEHTDEVLATWSGHRGPGGREASAAPPGGVGAAVAPLPFEGLKVLDLTWSIAGPYVGRTLADFGATVVKVESRERVDVTRTVVPLHPLNEVHPLEGGGTFGNTNAGKLGLELNLTRPEARDVLWDLVRWADVVVESFSAGALERMGYGYERLREVNPGVVLLSSCLPGQTGTLTLPGYGNLSSALFGFHFTTRWPDRPAAGPFGAYTDTVSPRFALTGLIAALDHRRRTGEGQHLDLSQVEASLHFLAPGLLDAEVNGREFEPLGDADPEMAPHGMYPAAGEDRWVAIACVTDGDWQRLASEVGRADLAGMSLAERLERRAELDELVAAWTSPQDELALQERLQGLGVAAHRAQNSAECLADPQLAHRGHYRAVDHPLLGAVQVEGPRVLLSRTPGSTVASGPTYGQHTYQVLSELLGYDDDRIADLAAAEALG